MDTLEQILKQIAFDATGISTAEALLSFLERHPSISEISGKPIIAYNDIELAAVAVANPDDLVFLRGLADRRTAENPLAQRVARLLLERKSAEGER